jgi:four helix bundle protein
MRPHKRLNIWAKVVELIKNVYKITSEFPREELYGIVSQMRRAAISIASNIAEGCARKSNQEKIQFFTVSRGSLSELDAQLEISLSLDFINKDEYKKINEELDEISRMLQGLINSKKKHLITK